MKNYVSGSENITIVAPQAVTSGTPFLIGSFIGIPVSDAASGELVAVITEGVVNLTIKGSANIGTPIYFNNGELTTTATGISCGFTIESGNNQEIKVMLNKSITTKTDLSAYVQTAQLNAALVKACADPTVKAAIKTAATT